MGVGSHGIAHRDWRRIPQAEMEAEVTQSRAAIAAVLGLPVTEAGIPFGSYDGRVLAALRRAGYTAAWSSDRGRMDPAAFLRPRMSVQAGMTEAEVAAMLAGQLPLLAPPAAGAGDAVAADGIEKGSVTAGRGGAAPRCKHLPRDI